MRENMMSGDKSWMSARAQDEPLLLASELSLPMPVCTISIKAEQAIMSPKGGSPVATSRAFQHLQQASSSPWQALPVQSPLVSHDVTPGLPVLEPGDASPEARACPHRPDDCSQTYTGRLLQIPHV